MFERGFGDGETLGAGARADDGADLGRGVWVGRDDEEAGEQVGWNAVGLCGEEVRWG